MVIAHEDSRTKRFATLTRAGWTTGLVDLITEMEKGQLRFVRSFEAPIEKLFETCKTPATFSDSWVMFRKVKAEFRTGGKFQVPTKKGEVQGEF